MSIEVYRHYGLDLLKMKENGEEHDWGICKKEDAARGTGDMAGFGMGQSQRVIIDYDKGFGKFLVRRISMDYGTPAGRPVKESRAGGREESISNIQIGRQAAERKNKIMKMNETDKNHCPEQGSEKMYTSSEVFAMAVEAFFKTFVQQPTHGNGGEARGKQTN